MAPIELIVEPGSFLTSASVGQSRIAVSSVPCKACICCRSVVFRSIEYTPLHSELAAWPDATVHIWSGRRDSNSRPSAWEADALPTELLPLALDHSIGVSGRAGRPERLLVDDE